MSSSRQYCLDACSLITAKNGEYGFEVVPPFWKMLEKQIRAGVVYSPWAVYKEWVAGKDELSEWVREVGKHGLKVQPTNEVQEKYKRVVAFVQNHYEDHQAALFLGKADPWVIAQAWEDNTAIVTYEVAVDPPSKRVKIPNVCREVCATVRCMKTWEVVKALGGLR